MRLLQQLLERTHHVLHLQPPKQQNTVSSFISLNFSLQHPKITKSTTADWYILTGSSTEKGAWVYFFYIWINLGMLCGLEIGSTFSIFRNGVCLILHHACSIMLNIKARSRETIFVTYIYQEKWQIWTVTQVNSLFSFLDVFDRPIICVFINKLMTLLNFAVRLMTAQIYWLNDAILNTPLPWHSLFMKTSIS